MRPLKLTVLCVCLLPLIGACAGSRSTDSRSDRTPLIGPLGLSP